ncbi:TerC/Alx family metal homeostasis membrane protein [Dokdonia sp. Hel_I_53]|uniref:TerC/Alx family metal homeostasis membrane protein n=1 Tax=Dokdonia sp. Hel_I_53 TaxID=1566287 RepID=UPI00119A3627|nr:TerC/Alx family metal homeostasis membrane protein [Dokdonia sp. Hel_I_53]TVZ52279.1 tellurite resistance protein TerC [Dokdonia sp. Hel_I_53]
MPDYLLPWTVLIGHIVILLLLDFFVLHKKNQVISVKKASYETLFFVANALLFAGFIFWFYKEGLVENPYNYSPSKSVVTYLTGYLVELSLSVDNLFVIAVIFTSFKIPSQYQHKLLFLGILGAIIFRALLIGLGITLINKIPGMHFIFGAILLFTAFKMLKDDQQPIKNEEPKGLSKFFKFSKVIDGDKFVTRVDGKRIFTALFGALVTIEFTDLLFALDSIPAILAITKDPFIIYSSNIFAIMGLRSLYFFLANMLERFKYLKYSVFVILLFVAAKLVVGHYYPFPEWLSLVVIFLSLGTGILISIQKGKAQN